MIKKYTLLFIIIILLSACDSSTIQETETPLIPALPTSTQFTTFTPSPTLTTTLSPTSEGSDRLCNPYDFKAAITSPDINNPDTLIGFQPVGNWVPGEGWEESNGHYYPEFDYSVQGYKNHDQYLFILEEQICRIGPEGRHPLWEIRDYLLIQQLEENELIVDSIPLEFCCLFQENIYKRFDFKWEWFTLIVCDDVDPRSILLARYDINELPDKIEPGTQIPVEVFQGWLPDPTTSTFVEFPITEISCTILFYGA